MYKLSPSSLTFDWDSCKYCFYLRVKHGIFVSGIFPGIFGRMANLTSQFYLGKPTGEISPLLPPGVVKMREGFVKSMPIDAGRSGVRVEDPAVLRRASSERRPPLPQGGQGGQCFISGRFDALIEFDDGTYGIIDYKTSEAKEEHAAFYSRQLSAYAYALEHPAPRALSFAPISRLGLFIVTPDRFEPNPEGELAFVNRTTWVDVPRDDAAFLGLLGEVMAVLDSPVPPASSPDCPTCNYRKQMREFESS